MNLRQMVFLAIAVTQWLWASVGWATGFALSVSPPRLELHAQAGDAITQVLRLRNLGEEHQQYQVEAAYWDLTPGGELLFSQDNDKESCIEWVALSDTHLTLAPGIMHEYWFSLLVPKRQPSGECRFALLIRHLGQQETDFLAIGQVAVIGYVTVGAARPALTVERIWLDSEQKPAAICVDFYNAGSAHGRPSGRLSALQSNGKFLELLVPPQTVLPGRRHTFVLRPLDPDERGSLIEVHPTLYIQGKIIWEYGDYPVDKILIR